MGLRNWLTNRAVRGRLKEAYNSMGNDKKTTVLGVVLAGLIGSKVDWTKLAEGDLSQIGMLAGAIVTALLGFLINRKDKPKV